jgi:hypothetical protein
MKILYKDLKKVVKFIVKEQLMLEEDGKEVETTTKQIAQSFQPYEGKFKIKQVLNTPDNKKFDVLISDEWAAKIFKDMIEKAREVITKAGFNGEKLGTYSGTFIKGNLEVEMNKLGNTGFSVHVFMRQPLI